MVVESSDFAFAAPAQIDAGFVRLQQVNRGQELHHVTLVRIPDSGSVEELVAGTTDLGAVPPGYALVGGPNGVGPEGVSTAELELRPGQYALLCLIPSADHVPHFRKGMVSSLEVTPGNEVTPEGHDAAPAPVDMTLRLTEYGFGWERMPAAGRHRIRVQNVGMEPHEVFLARLEPGKSAQDLLVWIEQPHGPPPGEPLGGISPLDPQGSNVLTVDFTPGRYALICFLPGPDGTLHFIHGMIQEFDIPA